MNDVPQMIVRSQILQNHQNYVVWHHPPPQPYPQAFNVHSGRVNRKGNKPDKRKEFHRTGSGFCHVFKPGNPNANDSAANRSGVKGRRFNHQKRKFGGGGDVRLAMPFAPHNTTSFIIRAKKSGGIASLVSPCPVTPAILKTPTLSPAKEVVVEMAKEQWGLDSYGSNMKGLIRLRDEKYDSAEGGEGVAVEKRLEQDLSRFEMIIPGSGEEHNLENRVDEQDTQIAHLEEENLTLKERIFLMERELGELRRRVLCLETDGRGGSELEIAPGDAAGDVSSEKSVGNGGSGGDGSVNGDCNFH